MGERFKVVPEGDIFYPLHAGRDAVVVADPISSPSLFGRCSNRGRGAGRPNQRQALDAELFQRHHFVLELGLWLHGAEVDAEVGNSAVALLDLSLDREESSGLDVDVAEREI